MADTKDKIKDKIDEAADKAKEVTGTAVDKTKEVAKKVGEKIKDLYRHGNVRLPNERSGTFMVFKTFERISYGLIMEAKNVIRVGDIVQNP
jgi:hypothetical protein